MQEVSQGTKLLVTNLPESDGTAAIAIFVDRLSNIDHLALCVKEFIVEKNTELFIDHLFKRHGMNEVIISNRDPRFTSRFWKVFFQKLRTDLRFSTAIHYGTDGQWEATIWVLEVFLRLYAERSPHMWV